mmetsp:Transcript_8504/g.11737  ORF Transcript_8504/g.11737 Transcript_8504/m.11737 type:complete len:692 (-) Transcript_8504:48-2123(-)
MASSSEFYESFREKHEVNEIDDDDEFYDSAEYYDIQPSNNHSVESSRYDDSLNAPINPNMLSTSPPRKSVIARVKSTFVASNDEELSVTENDEIEIKDMDETPWGLGRRLSDGKQGWFPMEVLEQSHEIVHAIESSKKSVDNTSLVAQKTETKAHLANRLTIRPTKAELQQHNILPNSDASPALQDAQKQLDMKKKGDFLSNFFRTRKKHAADFDTSTLQISKNEITFGKSDFDSNEVLHDTFEIRNLSDHKAKWLIEWELNDTTHVMQSINLHFEPSKGSLSKHKAQTVKVSLELKNGTKAKDITGYLIVGGKRIHTFIVKTKSKFGVFGVDPATLDIDIDDDNELCVPAILLQLKECLKSKDGLRREGIFRISGNSATVDSLKKQINARLFIDSNDVYSIANLIKIWFRDLPTPVLQSLTRDQLFEEDAEKCVQAIFGLPEPQLSLVMWLIDLVIECASHQSESKMSVENLAIVIAPNLYQPDKTVDAMEGLIRTQKITKFLQLAVSGVMEHKKNGTLPKIEVQKPQKLTAMEADKKLRLAHGIQASRRRSQSVNDLRKPPLPTGPKPVVLPKPISPSNTIHVPMERHGRTQTIQNLQSQLEKQIGPSEEVLRTPGMRKATLGGNPPVPTYIRLSNDSKSSSTPGSSPTSLSPSSSPSKNSPVLVRKNTYHPTSSIMQDALNQNKTNKK